MARVKCDKCGREVDFTINVTVANADLRIQSWCTLDVLRYGFADVLGVDPSVIDNKVKTIMAITPASIQTSIDASITTAKAQIKTYVDSGDANLQTQIDDIKNSPAPA